MQRNAQTAAHHNAINDRDDGLLIIRKLAVEPIFVGEEVIDKLGVAIQNIISRIANIPTRTKGLGIGGVYHDLLNRIIIFPVLHGLSDDIDHLRGQ